MIRIKLRGRSRLGIAAVLLNSLALEGCCLWPATTEPIPYEISTISSHGERSERMLIMLPGRGDRMVSFSEHGFPTIAHGAGFDTLVVDAHFGYYMNRSLVLQLQQNILPLARAAGYEEIWFLGISMGGIGALLYTEKFTDQISGLILLAPYLGDVTPWDGSMSSGEDYEIAIWEYLRRNESSINGIPIYLGFGENDPRATDYGQFAEYFPKTYVFKSSGGHNWHTWKPILETIVERLKTQ